MTVNETAAAWGMTTDAVRKLVRCGRIPAEMQITCGKAIYILPDNAEKPEKQRPGPKRK